MGWKDERKGGWERVDGEPCVRVSERARGGGGEGSCWDCGAVLAIGCRSVCVWWVRWAECMAGGRPSLVGSWALAGSRSWMRAQSAEWEGSAGWHGWAALAEVRKGMPVLGEVLARACPWLYPCPHSPAARQHSGPAPVPDAVLLATLPHLPDPAPAALLLHPCIRPNPSQRPAASGQRTEGGGALRSLLLRSPNGHSYCIA